MANLTLRNIKKSYGKIDVIHGIDLDIASGEFIVFVGPSGCGKSTLLRMIAGLEEITDGSLMIGDEVVDRVSSLNLPVDVDNLTHLIRSTNLDLGTDSPHLMSGHSTVNMP